MMRDGGRDAALALLRVLVPSYPARCAECRLLLLWQSRLRRGGVRPALVLSRDVLRYVQATTCEAKCW